MVAKTEETHISARAPCRDLGERRTLTYVDMWWWSDKRAKPDDKLRQAPHATGLGAAAGGSCWLCMLTQRRDICGIDFTQRI